MRTHLILACLAAPAHLPLAAAAQDFQPREGCTHVVTIQSDGCYVRNVVTCPEMGEGYVVYGTGADGKVLATVLDPDGATLLTGPEGGLMALQDRIDLFSQAALLASGTDSFDYTLRAEDGAITRFVGTATLTGETVTVEERNMPVVLTQQQVTPPGAPALTREITSYYDPDLALMLAVEGRDPATGKVAFQRPPVDFLFPGEEGALSATPAFGCAG